ncbi:S-methyl-5-thioribose kinase [Paraglaciecola sp. MB-3u-78]|jgi:5-methylthioribose kinase|uniref:S-methyl-5-thioribose kinase n=1 Tax=Paraglaciecola sp. MB-3u-78 TaxID=2058332 RepID=UPI000C31F85B|nr:S-methyl-5-thioribose kinase [Paraglaciecola sp. MB-3u-78]PKG93352.1 S-methyl-5-thioribose kinase [Paraglaciecola sp. MB-3u-78]
MEYYQLTQTNLTDYLKLLPEVQLRFSSFDSLKVQEINDGNMNYAFVVTNKLDTNQSVFVKQAPPYIKVLGEQWPLTRQRMTAEINALNYQVSVCPEMVPEVYYQSETLSVLIMENLSTHALLRTELIQGRYLPRLAEDLSTFLAETLFYSSDFALPSADKKAMVSKSSNQEMCQITEDFVFTYPFEHHDMNDYNPALSQSIIDSIQKDANVRAHVAQMKFIFMNRPEALLHGDLHTSSVMVNVQQTFVIDPEFSFAGPMGFDIGALIANLYLSYFSHAHKSSAESVNYSQWLLQTIDDLWYKFEAKFLSLWSEHEQSALSTFMGKDLTGDSHQIFRQIFLQQVFSNTLGFAACKMIRRILGVAKVADFMQFEDQKLRAKLETQALKMATTMLLNRQSYANIGDVNKLAEDVSSI